MGQHEPLRDEYSSVVRPEKLRAIEEVYSTAWNVLEASGHVDKHRDHQQRDRLARIALDCLVDGLEPSAATAQVAVERFLARHTDR